MLIFAATALAQAVTILGISASASLSDPPLVPGARPVHIGPEVFAHPPSMTTPTILNYLAPSATPFSAKAAWGDSIHEAPGDFHRVYFQNVDGLRNDADEIALYVSSMAQFQTSTFCWADHGLALAQVPIQQALTRPIVSHFGMARSAHSYSMVPPGPTSLKSGYQPGGTLTTTTGKWVTRSKGKPILDPTGLGRWSGLCFHGKRGKKLAIVTAYRSPRQQSTGGYGFYDQQFALLLSKGIKKPNVRKQFISDITLAMNQLQLEGYEILLSLDANETNGQDKTDGIDSLVESCTLHDLHCLTASTPPATYKYGANRRIDYMLGSEGVRDSIRRAGFLAYDNGVFSKHRGLFVDMDFASLLGSVDSIVPPTARGLRSEDQRSVDRYLDAFKEYADEHHLWTRVSDLVVQAPVMPLDQVQLAYNAIDRDVTRAMLHAEKQAKKPTGKYEWSPKLREAGLLARYWHLRLKVAEGKSNCKCGLSRVLERLKSLNIVFDSHATCNDVPEIKVLWKSALKMLRTVRDKAYDHRAVHLQATLQHYENLTFTEEESGAAANKLKVARLHRLINTESMRKPFRAIHSMVTPLHGGGLSKLFVPSGIQNKKVAAKYCAPDGTITRDNLIKMAQSDKHSVEYATLLDADAIEEELLRYNSEWFRQAAATPFGQGDLFAMVGYDGLTDEADAIVEGDCIEYLGIPMSRETQVFLEECRRPANVAQVETVISVDDFIATVKAWKETTSTSPSGRHLGHYRTALLDDAVVHLHTELLNLPIAFGFAPERWTHSVTPLIEKDDGLPYLTRLRVIHLFEADYNLFLKLIFGKRLVRNAEKAEALNDQQHGSRPRRMTTDALFLARLEKDLLRQIKANSAHMDNDATGCYDRIVTSLGMIACRRLGMPTHAIACQAEALRLMRYAVKHSARISAKEYTGTALEPLFGTGQGSGASPAIWLALVVVLLNSLDRLSKEYQIPGLAFTDPWGDLHEAWRVGAFVDDTNQGVMDALGTLTMDELVEQMRRAGQLWETLLHTSGGCLNLAKCSWTIQYWTWTNGRPSLLPIQASDTPLLMTSGSSPEHHIIKQHNNQTELKGLGVYLNFAGTFSTHAKNMRFKFDAMARRLHQSSMSATLSRKYYNTFYLPAVRYSLPVTSMLDPDLHRAQSLMTATILNKLGYNRHYPHAVAFAPTHVFGVGLADLRIEQGLAHVQALLDYVGTDHKIGRVMLISLRHLQLEAGVSFDILAHPCTPLMHLTDCWFTALRRFCADYQVSIRVLRNRIPQPAREGDQLLMDVAITLGLSRRELVDLNLTRTYMRATTVSDIATADGLSIHSWSWRGLRIPDRHGHLSFARQCMPTTAQRGLWRKLLRAFLSPTASSSSLTLAIALGPWIAPSNVTWGAYVHENTLYRRDPFVSTGERHVAVYFPRSLELSDGAVSTYYEEPPDWYAATVPRMASPADLRGDQIYSASHGTMHYPPISAHDESLKGFPSWLAELPPAEKRLVDAVVYDQHDADLKLLDLLSTDSVLHVGTDGGKKDNAGSFSWILCNPERERLIHNSGPVDGWYRCQSSLRSEAAALASFTLFIDEFACWANCLIKCHFHFYVDSTSAISNVKLIRDLIPKRRYANNADVLSILRAAPSLVSKYRLEHVKSHQDDTTDVTDLPFSAQLNVDCNALATAQLQRQLTHPAEASLPSPLPPRNLQVEVRYGDQVISSHYASRLRDAIGRTRHRAYLIKKYRWSPVVVDSIAWDSIEYCARRPNLTTPVTRSKLVHNWLNLGSQRAKLGRCPDPSIENRCPFCKAEETFEHLLTCPTPRATKFRYDAMAVLRKAVAKLQGGSVLLRAIAAWTLASSEPVAIVAPTPDLECAINTAVKNQRAIGWEHLFRGFASISWGHVYPVSDPTPPTEKTSRATAQLSTFIMAIQDYTIAIWQSRNLVLHEAGSNGMASIYAKLNHSIVQMYGLKETFAPIIQSYFVVPLEDRLRTSPRQRARWLTLVQLATSHASAQGSRQALVSHYFAYSARSGPTTNSTVPGSSSGTSILTAASALHSS